MLNNLKIKLAKKNIKYKETDDRIIIEKKGNFDISICEESKEFIIFLDAAHHHCENVDEVLDILNYAILGKLVVVNKLRGDNIVGSQIQIIENNGDVSVLVTTGALFSPFWKKKSFERKNFKNT